MFLLADPLGLLRRPAATLARIDQHRRLAHGLLGITVSVAIPALIAELDALARGGPAQGVPAVAGDLHLLSAAFFGWVYAQRFILPLDDLVASLGLWLLAVSLVHLVAKRLGGRGAWAGYLGLSGSIALTGLLAAPVQLVEAVLRALGNAPAADSLGPVSGSLGIALFAWQNVLLVMAAARHYRLPTDRAVAAVVGPAAAIVALGVTLVVAGTVLALLALGSNG
ncbi:MAG TPA: YIP1 family protein [Candidatus Limnocylindrales bacterium]|nr:YIP1 family protein [Candidatus Limnocylindrales bacterium]